MATPFSVVGLLERDGLFCGVTRRNKPGDWGLPGGKIDPTDESPEAAVRRELLEEIRIIVVRLVFLYERLDSVDGRNAWCYRILEWEGEPTQGEPGIDVGWLTVPQLLDSNCTFHEYNFALFSHLGLVNSSYSRFNSSALSAQCTSSAANTLACSEEMPKE
jgi:8-oxo-dGTP pyrophosphatase MutT (NUDIX family)